MPESADSISARLEVMGALVDVLDKRRIRCSLPFEIEPGNVMFDIHVCDGNQIDAIVDYPQGQSRVATYSPEEGETTLGIVVWRDAKPGEVTACSFEDDYTVEVTIRVIDALGEPVSGLEVVELDGEQWHNVTNSLGEVYYTSPSTAASTVSVNERTPLTLVPQRTMAGFAVNFNTWAPREAPRLTRIIEVVDADVPAEQKSLIQAAWHAEMLEVIHKNEQVVIDYERLTGARDLSPAAVAVLEVHRSYGRSDAPLDRDALMEDLQLLSPL